MNLLKQKMPRVNSTHTEGFSAYETTPTLDEIRQEAFTEDMSNIIENSDRSVTMSGAWVNPKDVPIESIQLNNNNTKVYMILQGQYLKMATEEGDARYVKANGLDDFSADNWDSYAKVDDGKYILNFKAKKPPMNLASLIDIPNDEWRALASLNNDNIEKTINAHNGVPTDNKMNIHLDDINSMIEQTNMVYTLGTVTGLTLLIAGIFISRE